MVDNEVTMLIADKTKPSPEIDALLRDLGNAATAIPFYAIYPGDGREPIRLNDVPLLQESLLDKLKAAVTPASNVANNESAVASPM